MTILYKITQQASDAVTRLEEVVRMEQKKLNSMVESMPDGVIMTDKDYRVLVANPSIVKTVGLSQKKDITIFDFIDLLGGKFDIRGKLEESTKLDKIIEVSDVMIGEKFYHLIVSPVKSTTDLSKGQILGGVVIFHDITRDKELEELRKDFTSMMVHELRSPLDGIHKITDLIIRNKKAIKPSQVTNEYLPIINKSSSDMLLLVNKLLEAAKIESGKYIIFPTSNDIVALINDRIAFYRPSALTAKIALNTQIQPNLPAKLIFDNNAITEVFNNFISNALRYNKEDGSITIQAFLHYKGQDIINEAKTNNVQWFVTNIPQNWSEIADSLIIAVTDTGMGIGKDNIPLLFNKFRQFNAVAQAAEKKGTGLGLVISKGIIEAHGGLVAVASKEDQGSTFYFSLPLNLTITNAK